MMPPKGRFTSSMPKAMGTRSKGSNFLAMPRYRSTQATAIMTSSPGMKPAIIIWLLEKAAKPVVWRNSRILFHIRCFPPSV
jgi:hypothetical protein